MEGRKRPAESYQFKLVLGGHETAGVFREATAEVESEVVDLAEPQSVRGFAKVGNITLKRGIDQDKSLWEWRKKTIDGGVDAARVDGQIQLLDHAGSPIATYAFERAWPSKVQGPDFSARRNEVAIESIVIAHEGLTLE